MSLWYYSFLMAVVVLFIMPQAHSTEQESFGIVLSQTCRTMIQNNVTTDCPTYEELITLFPDTSNQRIIGEFGYKDGMYQRLSSQYKNSAGFYQLSSEINQNLMFIDPPAKLFPKLNLITISPSLDEYLLRNQGADNTYDKIDHTMTLGTGRYVESCRTASIDGNDWLFLVGDTIQYLKNECDPSSTNFNSTTTIQLYKIKHDITSSYKYKLDNWFKESIDRCGQKICFYGKNQTSPP